MQTLKVALSRHTCTLRPHPHSYTQVRLGDREDEDSTRGSANLAQVSLALELSLRVLRALNAMVSCVRTLKPVHRLSLALCVLSSCSFITSNACAVMHILLSAEHVQHARMRPLFCAAMYRTSWKSSCVNARFVYSHRPNLTIRIVHFVSPTCCRR